MTEEKKSRLSNEAFEKLYGKQLDTGQPVICAIEPGNGPGGNPYLIIVQKVEQLEELDPVLRFIGNNKQRYVRCVQTVTNENVDSFPLGSIVEDLHLEETETFDPKYASLKKKSNGEVIMKDGKEVYAKTYMHAGNGPAIITKIKALDIVSEHMWAEA
jgi:hypothetical protein